MCKNMNLSTDLTPSTDVYTRGLKPGSVSSVRLGLHTRRVQGCSLHFSFCRDICVYTLMLLLHLLMAHGRFSQDERALNQAVRDTFTR